MSLDCVLTGYPEFVVYYRNFFHLRDRIGFFFSFFFCFCFCFFVLFCFFLFFFVFLFVWFFLCCLNVICFSWAGMFKFNIFCEIEVDLISVRNYENKINKRELKEMMVGLTCD